MPKSLDQNVSNRYMRIFTFLQRITKSSILVWKNHENTIPEILESHMRLHCIPCADFCGLFERKLRKPFRQPISRYGLFGSVRSNTRFSCIYSYPGLGAG